MLNVYTLADICNEIVENQDLYGNKEDFWKERKTINWKDFIFHKYIFKILWQILNEIVENKDIHMHIGKG